MQAMTDLSQNPSNFAKYQSNPKFAKLAEKMQRKFGGSFPGMGGEGASGSGSPPPPSSSSSVPEQPDVD